MNEEEKRKRLDVYCRAQTGCSDCLMDGDGFGCRRVHNVPACMSDAEIEIVFDDFKLIGGVRNGRREERIG